MTKTIPNPKFKRMDPDFEYTKIKVKCDKCGGVFQFGLKIIYPPKNVDGKGVIMGMGYALDENGEDIGFIGYF